jgi:DNA polymerase III epsilon subunit-like protein
MDDQVLPIFTGQDVLPDGGGMTRLAFIDTETTGLDPRRHQLFEIAMLIRDGRESTPEEYHWWLSVNLTDADSTALRLTRYYERQIKPTLSVEVAGSVAQLTAGAHLVGAVPSFDAAFLETLLRAYNLVPAWHYHLVDVEALAAGYLHQQPPWNSEELSRTLGVEPPQGDEPHTALGDARWAMAMYDAVMK